MLIIDSPPPAELSIVKPHRRRVLSPELRRTAVSNHLALARRLRGERSVFYFSVYHVELGAGLTFAISVGPYIYAEKSHHTYVYTHMHITRGCSDRAGI